MNSNITITKSNSFDSAVTLYFYHFILLVISGVFGLVYGAYNIPYLSLEESLLVSFYRPLFEYFIVIYLFIYFVVLANYMIRNKDDVDYFFKVFSTLFYFTLIVGFCDIALGTMIPEYSYRIPRHLYDMRDVGNRFHGVAGEPRDAFVYLIFGLGILWLKGFWRDKKELNSLLILSIIIALLLTQSASGLIGLVLSSILLLIFLVPYLTINKIMVVLLIVFLLNVMAVVGVSFSSRLIVYYDAFFSLYDTLSNGEAVTSILEVVMNNIYPVWHRWTEVLNLNIVPLLIGTGLGSTSVINNVYHVGFNTVLNSNANIVRTLFDTGIFGVLTLILAFIVPIRRLLAPKRVLLILLFFMLLILGAYFAHRSAVPFIFLGVMLVVVEKKFHLVVRT